MTTKRANTERAERALRVHAQLSAGKHAGQALDREDVVDLLVDLAQLADLRGWGDVFERATMHYNFGCTEGTPGPCCEAEESK